MHVHICTSMYAIAQFYTDPRTRVSLHTFPVDTHMRTCELMYMSVHIYAYVRTPCGSRPQYLLKPCSAIAACGSSAIADIVVAMRGSAASRPRRSAAWAAGRRLSLVTLRMCHAALLFLAFLPEILAFRSVVALQGGDDVVGGLLHGCASAGGSAVAAMAVASSRRLCHQETARREPAVCCACARQVLQLLRQKLAPDSHVGLRVVAACGPGERSRSVDILGDLRLMRSRGRGRPCLGARDLAAIGLAELVANVTVVEKSGRLGRSAASSLIGLPPRKTTPPVDTEVCAICLNDLERPLRVRCGHRFCRRCIQAWLSRNEACPLCRRPALSRLRAAGRRIQHAWLRAWRNFDRNVGFDGRMLLVLGFSYICIGLSVVVVLRAVNLGGTAGPEVLAWCLVLSGGLLIFVVATMYFSA